MKKTLLLGIIAITGICFNWNAEEIFHSKNLPKELEWFYFSDNVIVIPYLSGMQNAGFIIYYPKEDTYKIFHPAPEYKSDIITFSVCNVNGCLCGAYFAGGAGGDPEGGMKLYYITGKSMIELESKPQSFFMDTENFLTCLPNKICYLSEKVDNQTRRIWVIQNQTLEDKGTYSIKEKPYFTSWGDVLVFKREENSTTIIWNQKTIGNIKENLNVKNCYEVENEAVICGVIKNYREVITYTITKENIREEKIIEKSSPLIEKLMFLKTYGNKTALVYQNPIEDYYLVYKEENKLVEDRLPKKGTYYEFEINNDRFIGYAVEYEKGIGTTLWKVWANTILLPDLVLIPRIIDVQTKAGEKTFISLVIHNIGFVNATNVVVRAQNYSYELGEIKSFESINANIPVQFNFSGNYTITISVSSKEPDLNPKDNEFNIRIYVSCVSSSQCKPDEYCKNGTCVKCTCEIQECRDKLGDKCKQQPQVPEKPKQKETIDWYFLAILGVILGALILAILRIKKIKENY